MKALPIDSMSEGDLTKELNKLKDNVKSKNNPYVNDVLARGQWQIKHDLYRFSLLLPLVMIRKYPQKTHLKNWKIC